MAKTDSGKLKYTRVKPVTNAAISALFIVLALLCLMPALLVLIVSLSSEASIRIKGYSYIPLEWSLKAFEYLAKIHDYSAIILCVIGGVQLSREAKCYVREVLSKADLNNVQKEQFKQLRRGCLLEV